MSAAAAALALRDLRVARFEFGYMASRRSAAGKQPPPRAETLQPEYVAAIERLAGEGPLVIGGKSLGGRVASMVADRLWGDGRILGLLCLGYPFHPPGRPQQLRTAHLLQSQVPALFVQGTRDEFGTIDEVPGYGLPPSIRMLWLEDGDHDLKPRRGSGHSSASHLATMADSVSEWVGSLLAQPSR